MHPEQLQRWISPVGRFSAPQTASTSETPPRRARVDGGTALNTIRFRVSSVMLGDASD